MGNKTNATGMRIGVNQPWKSVWYADKKNYADLSLQDKKLRAKVFKDLAAAGVADVTVKRFMNSVEVAIRVARPGVVIGKGGEGIERFQKELRKLTKIDTVVRVLEVKRPEIVAKLIADNIAAQCVRRIAPKRAAQKAVDAAMDTGLIEGIRVLISGRIRGAEIARKEQVYAGNVPNHTLRANIDFAQATAQVPAAGVHGIKVWVNRGEKHTYELE